MSSWLLTIRWGCCSIVTSHVLMLISYVFVCLHNYYANEISLQVRVRELPRRVSGLCHTKRRARLMHWHRGGGCQLLLSGYICFHIGLRNNNLCLFFNCYLLFIILYYRVTPAGHTWLITYTFTPTLQNIAVNGALNHSSVLNASKYTNRYDDYSSLLFEMIVLEEFLSLILKTVHIFYITMCKFYSETTYFAAHEKNFPAELTFSSSR